MRQRKLEAWARWRGLVAEQSQSGQSVAGFCIERGLRSSQFFAWKRRLREAEAAKFVAVEVTPVREASWPASAAHSGAIKVRLCRGRSMVVAPGFDAHHLRALLSVLEAKA